MFVDCRVRIARKNVADYLPKVCNKRLEFLTTL